MSKKQPLLLSDWQNIFSQVLDAFTRNIWKFVLVFAGIFTISFFIITFLTALSLFPSQKIATTTLMVFFLILLNILYMLLADAILQKRNFFENIQEMFFRYLGNMFLVMLYIVWPLLILLFLYIAILQGIIYFSPTITNHAIQYFTLPTNIFLGIIFCIALFRSIKAYFVLPRLLLYRETSLKNIQKSLLPHTFFLLKILLFVVLFVAIFYFLPLSFFSLFSSSKTTSGIISFLYSGLVFAPLYALFFLILAKKIFPTKKTSFQKNNS